MSKKRRIFLISLILILLIVLFIPLLVNIDFVNRFIKSRIEASIANSIGGKCEIWNIKSNIASVNIDSIYIENKDFNIYVRDISGGISLFALPFKKLLINYVIVKNADLEFSFNRKDSIMSNNDSIPNNIEYKYVFENIPFTIDISTIELKDVNIKSKDLSFDNINITSSFTINRKQAVMYVNIFNCDIVNYVKINRSNMQLMLSKQNALIKGNFNSNKGKLNYYINVYEQTIDIREFNYDFKVNNFSIDTNTISSEGNITLNGFYKKNSKYANLKCNIDYLKFNDCFIDSIDIFAFLHNDSLILEQLYINNENIDLSITGICEIDKFPLSEITVNINRFSLKEIIRDENIKEHDLNGKIILHTNSFNNFTLIMDSLNGDYDNKIFFVNGVISYNDKSFYAKKVEIDIDRGELILSGSMSMNKGMLSIDMKDISTGLLNYLNIPVLGEMSGQIFVKGGINNYRINYDVSLSNFIYHNISSKFINVAGNIVKTDALYPDILLTSKIIQSSIGQSKLSMMYLELKKEGNSIYTDFDALADVGYIQFSGEYEVNNNLTRLSGLLKNLNVKTEIDNISLIRPVYINLSKDTIEINNFEIIGKNLVFSGNFFMTDNEFDINITYNDDSLQFIKFFTNLDIKGDLKTQIRAKGTIKSPQLELSIKGDNLYFEGITADSLRIENIFSDSIFSIEKFKLFYDSSSTELNGHIKVNDLTDFSRDSFFVKATINGVDSVFFAPLFDIFTLNKGNAFGEIDIYGNLLNPKFKGGVYINHVGVYIVPLGTYVDDVNGYAELKGNDIIIKNVNGRTEKGKLLLNGNVIIKNYMLDFYNFDIIASGAHVEGIDYLDAYGDCDLNIRGTIKRPEIRGTIFAIQAESNFPFLDLNQGPPSTKIDSSFFDITIKGDKDLWIRNNFVNSELAGNIRLYKDVSKWKITGRASIIRGNYFYLDKKFKIDEGYFDLIESSKMIDLYINLSSHTKINYYDIDGNKNATVYLSVTGKIDKPEISMYSEPAMGVDNIISILSFNTTVSGLNKFQNLSKTLPEKALQIYLRNNAYLNRITSSIGIDQFNIETEFFAEEKSARLSVGKYIGNKLFVSYTHDLFSFSRDIFKVEYSVLRNAEIVVEKDDGGEFNTGFQFKIRY